MGLRSLPNTVRRLAIALGDDPTGLRSSIPNTAKRLSMLLGLSVDLGSSLPNTGADLETAFGGGGGGGGGGGWILSGGTWNDAGAWDDGASWED